MILKLVPSLWNLQISQNYRHPHLKNMKPVLCVSSINVKSNSNRKVIVCGLRKSYAKKPPSRVLSKEAIQVIHSLKLAKSDEKLDQVLNSSLTRLLKVDVLDLLAELQRQNHFHLCLKVFNFIREEPGYNTLLSLYSDMILLHGRNKNIDMAEELFSHVTSKGLKPDTRMYTEMIGAYIRAGMMEKAIEIYRSMKASGCSPDRLTFMILIRNLERMGEQELVATLKEECYEYVEFPNKFIKEVEQKYSGKTEISQSHKNVSGGR
ncbi:PREDICTED: pentatricopeptide repeat-containing protein At3g46870-like [Lupinus angustifolius]|nr:PREDICTED: pentatricopeptide repeat-containing protein At3g46870-like [Lupinus angustifolius]XP_019437517.1 PREDICTED: pentatricopeptide repeat-containing protein At3g46870-like [Lupinus angustifolius]